MKGSTARGQAENHIKAWKNHLATDRTSCHAAEANQFRLFLHAGAYWLLWSMRRVMPKRSAWRVMQFDSLRLRLVKLAARVVELKTQLKIHLPSSAPDQGNPRHAPRPPAASHRLTEGAYAPEPARFPPRFSAHSIPPTNPPHWTGSGRLLLPLQPLRARHHTYSRYVVCSCIDRARQMKGSLSCASS